MLIHEHHDAEENYFFPALRERHALPDRLEEEHAQLLAVLKQFEELAEMVEKKDSTKDDEELRTTVTSIKVTRSNQVKIGRFKVKSSQVQEWVRSLRDLDG